MSNTKAEILLSASLQDCLEALLEIEKTGEKIRVTDVAKRLNIAKASVKQTVDRLKLLGLVIQESYGPILLTEKGRETGEIISSRHRKLSRFLTEVLGVDQETAENDACLMEHAVSTETMDKLTEFLCRNGYITEGCKISE